jgi:hypothetical protein
MSVFAQSFLSFMGRHFVAFSFLSTWHNAIFLNYLIPFLTLSTNVLAGLKAGML